MGQLEKIKKCNLQRKGLSIQQILSITLMLQYVYMYQKNKSVILLTTMHMTGEVENTESAKPEIIKYYNENKGGVDVMDKMLGEYTVKRRTLRWPLAFFCNMIYVAALASYVIYTYRAPSKP